MSNTKSISSMDQDEAYGMQPSDLAERESLDQFLNRLDKLHSSPTVALRVMELTRDPEFPMDEVANCLELDPALSTAILRLINSSYYGLADDVTNLRHALTYLGRRSLRLSVLSFGLVKTLVSGAPARFHMQYWKRSLTMAAAARECAKLVDGNKVDPDTAFAAGLIADLGMLAMAQLETEAYLEIADEPDHTIDLVQRERDTFGFDHIQVSTKLMQRWDLPKDLVDAVSNHHTYLPVSSPLNHVALVANLIAEVIWTPVCPYMQPMQQVMYRQLGMDIDDLISLVLATKQSIDESSGIFGVTLPGEIDAEEVELLARDLFKKAALDLASDMDCLEAFSSVPLG